MVDVSERSRKSAIKESLSTMSDPIEPIKSVGKDYISDNVSDEQYQLKQDNDEKAIIGMEHIVIG